MVPAVEQNNIIDLVRMAFSAQAVPTSNSILQDKSSALLTEGKQNVTWIFLVAGRIIDCQVAAPNFEAYIDTPKETTCSFLNTDKTGKLPTALYHHLLC